jgi:hypothetical protein
MINLEILLGLIIILRDLAVVSFLASFIKVINIILRLLFE